jgi:hypothetical protein
MGKVKGLIIIAIILISIVASFGLPKIKYQSFDIINHLNIPLLMGNWSGKELPNNEKDIKRWDFINKAKQYHYYKTYGPYLYHYYSFLRKDGTQIYFSLLNAGNFHDPKTCYTGIGYKPRYEGKHNVILAKNTALQFDSWLMLKKNSDLLTTYWMCIDGKKVSWLELKLNELICSLTNKKSVNLLTRIDVPANPGNTDNALAVTKDFIRNLYGTLDKNERVYIFGK